MYVDVLMLDDAIPGDETNVSANCSLKTRTPIVNESPAVRYHSSDVRPGLKGKFPGFLRFLSFKGFISPLIGLPTCIEL